MTIRTRRQTNVGKQTTLLDGVDVGLPKKRVCWRDLNRSVHEAMNNISNIKVHLKTRSLNVNINMYHDRQRRNWWHIAICDMSSASTLFIIIHNP